MVPQLMDSNPVDCRATQVVRSTSKGLTRLHTRMGSGPPWQLTPGAYTFEADCTGATLERLEEQEGDQREASQQYAQRGEEVCISQLGGACQAVRASDQHRFWIPVPWSR